MRKMLQTGLCLVGSALIVLLLSVLVRYSEPIDVDLPFVNKEELTEREEAQQKAAREAAARARMRRIYSCSSDDDCIIVDKDPCGCLVGPQGVVSINADYTLDFDKVQAGNITKACPEVAPSQEKECSASAHAVCKERTCVIEY